MSKEWQTQQERGNPFFLGLLTWIALRLGRRVVIIVLHPIVFYYFLFARKARQASRFYLTRVMKRSPKWREIYHHLFHFALVSVDRLYFLAGKEAIFDVHVHGNELFNSYKNRGCFLLTAHIGSVDVLRLMGMGLRQNALPVRILLDIRHNANILALLQKLDPQLAQGIIDARTPAPQLALILNEAIENAQLIGVMADRCAQGERNVSIDFLGKPAKFPQGVWQMASLLKAPVFSCLGVYSGKNRYDLYFDLISDQLGAHRETRNAEIITGMTAFVHRLEDIVQKAPYNWFNFYDFWQDETTDHH